MQHGDLELVWVDSRRRGLRGGDGLVLAAARDHDLWRELADLLDNIAEQRQERLATRFAAAPAELTDAVRAATKSGALSKAALAKLTG
jgi:hypothetical protein